MKIVAVCSGGLDSTILAHVLREEGHEVIAVNFNYGSKHNERERQSARAIFGESLIELDIDLSMFNSALLKSNNKDIPEGHYEDAIMKETVVPFRNGIMLSYAVGLAESMGFDAVALGNHYGDNAVYPDCRKEFVEGFTLAAKAGTYNQIKLLAPFTGISKSDIVVEAMKLGLAPSLLAETWSCYKGEDVHCGKCGTCVERKEAFELAGCEDLTVYAPL